MIFFSQRFLSLKAETATTQKPMAENAYPITRSLIKLLIIVALSPAATNRLSSFVAKEKKLKNTSINPSYPKDTSTSSNPDCYILEVTINKLLPSTAREITTMQEITPNTSNFLPKSLYPVTVQKTIARPPM